MKGKDELFSAFVGRYRQLVNECKEVKLEIDEDVLFGHAVDALLNSEDQHVRDVYGDVLVKHGDKEFKDAEELFDTMKARMKMIERLEREKEEEFQTKKKKKDKRARQKVRKARELAESSDSSDSSEDEKEYQAVARKAAVNKSESEDVRGVCHWHQEGRCFRGKECSFEHRMLSKEGQEKLKEMMKAKNERKNGGEKRVITPIRCFTCGKEGHISSQCPKMTKKNVTKMTFAEAADSDSKKTSSDSMMSKATAGMTDEQVKLFAKEMFEMSETAKNQY